MTENDTNIVHALAKCITCEEDETPYEGAGFWQQKSEPAVLAEVYSKIPLKFPNLYEQLLLEYRWMHAWLGDIQLISNPPAADLTPFVKQHRLWDDTVQFCLHNGYLMFGHGFGGGHDFVCIQTSDSKKSKKDSIVVLDHEHILCFSRIRQRGVLASNFLEFASDCIKKSEESVV